MTLAINRAKIFSFLLFKYVETSPQMLTLFGSTIQEPKSAPPRKKKQNDDLIDWMEHGADPIKLARGDRGYVFPSFTSMTFSSSRENRDVIWSEFDIAAFKEALKTIHQIDLKTDERNNERAVLEAKLDFMLGKSTKAKSSDDTDESIPVVAGDPRIEVLEQILAVELAAEYDMSDGETVAYGLGARTVRGFPKLRDKWRRIAGKGVAHSESLQSKLRDILVAFQAENSETIGSVALFERLMKPDAWFIWQEPSDEQWAEWDEKGYASDPLKALAALRRLQEDIERLKRPVRLTPADPEHSPRHYMFSDVSGSAKKPMFRDGKGVVDADMAVRDVDGVWSRIKVRVHFNAPRMRRDFVESPTLETLEGAIWCPPVMAPLDMDRPEIGKVAFSLMPKANTLGGISFLLNFAVTISGIPNRDKVVFSEKQFIGFKEKRSALLWDCDKGGDSKLKPWYEACDHFTLLAIDLGQRSAAAVALLHAEARTGKGRVIGKAEGKTWTARLGSCRICRLPGEDATVLRDGEWKQELSGKRGRKAEPTEISKAVEIAALLDAENIRDRILEKSVEHAPELNDLLLTAIRRAQGRLRAFQSWSYRIVPPESSAKARDEMTASKLLPRPIADALAKNDLPATKALLCEETLRLRSVIAECIEYVADRVLPLRGRRWVWSERKDGSKCHILAPSQRGTDPTVRLIKGQRGLSISRLEQVEELRRRCQSFNRALMHRPGEKPEMGRRARGVQLPDPCPDILKKLEQIREQRVDQTAHHIVAEALGVRLKPHGADRASLVDRDIHGEYERIPGRTPVDFIVMEDLSRYLGSQERPRRENSRLMKWCHRAILDKVRELCEPFGIQVVEVNPSYSSRFCSRSGLPGFRAVELTPDARFQYPWKGWLDELEQHDSGVKKLEKEKLAHCEHVRKLFDDLVLVNWTGGEARPMPRTLLAPIAGGPLFVSWDGHVQQADLNAAINLGLRAIARPTQLDIHAKVRTERKKGVLLVRRANKQEQGRWPEPDTHVDMENKAESLKEDRNPNFFHDPSRVAKYGRAMISGKPYASSQAFWGEVKKEAWVIVEKINTARVDMIVLKSK